MHPMQDQVLEAQAWQPTCRTSQVRMAISRFRWKLILIATVLCLAITYVLLPQSIWSEAQHDESLYGTQGPSPAHDEIESQMIRLHPGEHTFREPTTVHVTWKITAGLRRPDGVLKRVYLINDAFPGPTIEARSGDRLVIEVENTLDNDDQLSIHWHGLTMRNFNDMDGASGVTQDPIHPGANFTYDFQIETTQFGTFWYHAHDSVQRGDGMYGGLVVHEPGPRHEEVPSVQHLLMLGDWYHRPAKEVLGWYMDPGNFGMEPTPDSILLNGIGQFECSDAVPAQPIDCERMADTPHGSLIFDATKINTLRIINVGSIASFSVNTVRAGMTIINVDGGNSVASVPVGEIGLVAPGERVDLVLAPQDIGHNDATLSIVLDKSSFKIPNPALTPERRLGLQWKGIKSQSSLVNEVSKTPFNIQQASGLRNGKEEVIPSQADQSIVLYTKTEMLAHLNNVPRGFINHTSWTPQSKALNSVPADEWNHDQLVPHVHYNSSAPLWVDIILNNLDEDAHPFHLHGHNFWVLATYSSSYNWGSFNPFEDEVPPGGPCDVEKALKKDTVIVPRRGYAILRFKADNPGLWMLHCHVLWHQASGMAMAIDVS